MKIKLVAYSLELFYAWKKYFDNIADVEIIDGDILEQVGDAIVSPANSFGFMDGGLDLKYSQYFGWDLESRVREKLESEFFGELPVGNAIIVNTLCQQVPYLITAPTMRAPSNVSKTVNSYLAFKAVLQTVLEFNEKNSNSIKSILCPGLGTGEGNMPAEKCAKQMFWAYQVCMMNNMLNAGGLASAVNEHLELLGELK